MLGAGVTAVACAGDEKQAARGSEAGEAGSGGVPSDGGGGAPASGGAGAPPDVGGAGGQAGLGGGAAGSVGDEGGNGGALTGAGGAGGEGGAGSEVVADISFEGDTLPPQVDAGTSLLTPSQGYEGLGYPGNQFGSTFLRGVTGNAVTVTITDLPPHTTLSIGMLFAAIDSLDGTGTFPAGDFFHITLDGVTIFRESFANAIETQIQSYAPAAEVILARRVDLGFGGPGGYYTDSAYDFSLDPQFQGIPHTASTATLVFTLEGEGVQSLDDESWAIANLRVRAN